MAWKNYKLGPRGHTAGGAVLFGSGLFRPNRTRARCPSARLSDKLLCCLFLGTLPGIWSRAR
eukprot:11497027-Heterocapsa_arctica.AAC.1